MNQLEATQQATQSEGHNSSRRSARKITFVERAARALTLRRNGATYDEIAQSLGLSHRSNARRLVESAISEIIREPAEEVRALELARMDAIHAALWPAASTGHLPSIDRLLRVCERRARLLGLDRTPLDSPVRPTGFVIDMANSSPIALEG